ncbi:MAG: hypothetical protein JWN32_917 [Solirubrobacterales bacterium]|nr:hypothetical protein [Solirubrobacterales bacterium]
MRRLFLILGILTAASLGATVAGAATPRLPAQVTSKTTPGTRTKAAYRFTTTGSVGFSSSPVCPAGKTGIYCVPPPRRCIGGAKVVVTFKVGSNTISARRATVGTDCRFRSTVTFKTSRLRTYRLFHSKRGLLLTVKQRFEGDVELAPAAGLTHHVRVKG